MHVLLMMVGGFLLLAFFLLMGHLWGSSPQALLTAAKLFIPIWAVVALINVYVGVYRAGYSLREELPILLLIIAVPAGAAALLLWRMSR